ncbi:cell death activator cide-3-like, partial [Lynx pardinus]
TAKKIKVACKTFDRYKINPQDFVGCLRVKATHDGTYSISYDMHFYGVKCIMKEALYRPLCGMQ